MPMRTLNAERNWEIVNFNRSNANDSMKMKQQKQQHEIEYFEIFRSNACIHLECQAFAAYEHQLCVWYVIITHAT